MKKIIITLAFVCMTSITFAQQDTKELIGTWKIDLRPTQESKPYYQEFVIKSIDGKKFTGSFYGSPFGKGLFNTEWNKRVYFAFSTSDRTHTYYHSGYFQDGKVYGISYCPTRNLVSRWRGEN
jgi:hypothetical protein